MFAGILSASQRQLFCPAHHRSNKHTFFITPVVATMVSAPSTVLFATVFTLATTASPTTLACSLVFSATGISTKAESPWARHCQKAAKFTGTIKQLHRGKRRKSLSGFFTWDPNLDQVRGGFCLPQSAAQKAALQPVSLWGQLENEKFTVRS